MKTKRTSMHPLNKKCTRCGALWDGRGLDWKWAARTHCNICERKQPTRKAKQ